MGGCGAGAIGGGNASSWRDGMAGPDRIMRVTASTTPGAQPGKLGWPRKATVGLLAAARRNQLFTGALAAGALLRLIALIGFPGALWFAGDSYVYIGAALRPQPNLSKTTGYSLFLRALLPFHSLTLVVALQHLMGLAVAVIIYWLLRKHQVSRLWSTIATLPVLFDGFMIEDEHLIMAEALFTFAVMVALLLVLRTRRVSWWVALITGLLLGYAAIVRTEGAPFLALFPLFLLLRGFRDYGWKKLRAWAAPVVLALGCLAPVAGYALWFQSFTGHLGLTESTGYYLWGRVSSFADCAVIKPTGAEAAVCPKEPVRHRTAPGNFIWHAPEVHKDLPGGPVTPANNKLLTDFAIHAVEAQPLGYVRAVAHGLVMAVSPQREQYPSKGTVYYYYFHRHRLGIPHHSWIDGGYAPDDWVAYGHAKPGRVIEPFATLMIGYQRAHLYTWGPLLAIILATGLGGVIRVRRPVRDWRLTRRGSPLSWSPRGTTMLPWVTAIVMLVTPIALADFDYRYLLPVIPFACLAAGLAFAPSRRRGAGPAVPSSGPSHEATTPEITPV